MRRLSVLIGILAVVAGLAQASPIGLNLVDNPGFEDGVFGPWTWSYAGLNPILGWTSVESGFFVHSGTFSLMSGPAGDHGYLSQTFDTTPGVVYNLSFWLIAGGGDVLDTWEVLWNEDQKGTGIYDPAIYNPDPENLPPQWRQYTYSGLTATGSTSTLTFGFRNDLDYYFLDDVSVTAGVPEPAPIGLLLIGFGALIARLRKSA